MRFFRRFSCTKLGLNPGGIPLYGLHRYKRPLRVSFLSHFALNEGKDIKPFWFEIEHLFNTLACLAYGG